MPSGPTTGRGQPVGGARAQHLPHDGRRDHLRRPAGDLAATEGAVEQQGDDRTVDQAAALGGLRALEAAAGAARPEAGGEDGGALVGSEASGLSVAARYVDSVRSPKPPRARAG